MRSLAETIHGEVTVCDPRIRVIVQGATIFEASRECRRLRISSHAPMSPQSLAGAQLAGPVLKLAGPALFLQVRGPP